MNNETGVGGSGDFPIRTLLFSKELEEKNKNNQDSQARIIKEKRLINFSNKTTKKMDKKAMIKNLFQNYQPQVIEHTESKNTKSKLNIYFLGTIIGVILTILGIVIGNRKATRKRRDKKNV